MRNTLADIGKKIQSRKQSLRNCVLRRSPPMGFRRALPYSVTPLNRFWLNPVLPDHLRDLADRSLDEIEAIIAETLLGIQAGRCIFAARLRLVAPLLETAAEQPAENGRPPGMMFRGDQADQEFWIPKSFMEFLVRLRNLLPPRLKWRKRKSKIRRSGCLFTHDDPHRL